MELRNYQKDIIDQVMRSSKNDLVQLDTGAGKTPVEAELANRADFCILIAHRNVLITQISDKLSTFNIPHNTISTEYTRRRCMLAHKQYGKNFIDRKNRTKLVASIASLISHYKRNSLNIDVAQHWLIIIDEAHHVIQNNQWGKLRDIFKNSRIVGFTATPARLDGEALHVKNGGLFDSLIQADNLKTDSVSKLINARYLSDFVVYAPTEDQRVMFNTHENYIIFGDPVKEYIKRASGKSAVMMCPSILNSKEFAVKFRDAGISAASVSSIDSATEISRIIDEFIAGRIKVICNVDIVGEGFDFPKIECLIIANKTRSLVRYRQWVGRALRCAPEKSRAIIIDHVGIIAGKNGHGMPDYNINWDIENPPKELKNISHIPCKCGRYYEIRARKCPECSLENPFLNRDTSLGSAYIDLEIINLNLVYKEREKMRIEESKKLLEEKERVLSESIIQYAKFGNLNLFTKTADKIKDWFVQELIKLNISIRDINRFLEDARTKDLKFWIENFEYADIKKSDQKKSKRVYEKWLKLA